MIDLFSIVVTHALLALAAWRLALRADLDIDPVKADPVTADAAAEADEEPQVRRGMRLSRD